MVPRTRPSKHAKHVAAIPPRASSAEDDDGLVDSEWEDLRKGEALGRPSQSAGDGVNVCVSNGGNVHLVSHTGKIRVDRAEVADWAMIKGGDGEGLLGVEQDDVGNSDSKGSGPKEFGDPRIIAVLGPASPLEQGQGEGEGDDGRNESAEEWHMHTHHSGRGVGEEEEEEEKEEEEEIRVQVEEERCVRTFFCAIGCLRLDFSLGTCS